MVWPSLMHFAVPFFLLLSAAQIPAHPDTLRINDELSATTLGPKLIVFQSQPWDANSLVVVGRRKRAVLVDTPALPRTTEVLLDWLERTQGIKVVAAVNSHHHVDASGGNNILKRRGIPIWASEPTQALLERGNGPYQQELIDMFEGRPSVQEGFTELQITPPDHVFEAGGSRRIRVAGVVFRLEHHGPSHSPDHLAVVFPRLGVMYGGCAVRRGDSLGNTASVNDFGIWRDAIEKLKAHQARFVIPGHGTEFSPMLLDNTLGLLEVEMAKSHAL